MNTPKILTKKNFIAWMKNKAERTTAGFVFDSYSNPIARFLRQNGVSCGGGGLYVYPDEIILYTEEGTYEKRWALPKWANDFLDKFNRKDTSQGHSYGTALQLMGA